MVKFILAMVLATGLYLIWTAITGDKAETIFLKQAAREAEENSSDASSQTASEEEIAKVFAQQKLKAKRVGLLGKMSARSGLEVEQIQRSLVISLPGSLVGGLVAWLIWGWPVMLFLGGLAGAVAPVWWLANQSHRKRLLFEEDLASSIDTLSSLISAGLGISSAIKSLSETGPERLQSEFASIYEEASFFGLKAALQLAQDRLGNSQFDLVALSLITADTTGGEIAERMKRLARTIRANLAITRQSLAEQAGQVIAARLVSVTPLAVLTLIKLVNPSYVQVYSTDLGQVALISGLTLAGFGYFLMRLFSRLPTPKRTFSGNRK